MASNLNLSVTLSAINKATGPLKKILQGSRGVGRAMRETRGELKAFNDQQNRIQAFRDMSRQSQETRQALREKREALERVTRELKNATGPTRRLTQQQEKAQRAVDQLSGEYRDQRERVRELSRHLPKAADGVRGLTQQQDDLERKARATNERLNAQRQVLQRLSDADISGRFSKMTGEVGRLGRRTAFAGAAAAGGIFALANSTATLGDDVAKTSAKIGITSQDLQELRYGAERSGVSTQKLDSSMERFVKRLGEARQGGGAAAKAYEQLGLDASQLAELTPTEALARVADELGNVENHTDRVALMAKFFGREGVAMINMLKGGSQALDGFAADANNVGYVLGDRAPAEAEAFKDALLDAQSGLQGMKNTIGAELMPAVTNLMGELSGWMRKNRDQVKAFAREFGERLKTAVPVIIQLGKGVATFTATLGEMTMKAAAAVGGFDNLAMIVGGLFAGKAIASVLSFGIGIGKAIGAMAAFAKTLPIVATGIKTLSLAFAATPIGWVIAGITAVAGAAYLIYKHWEPIKAFMAKLWGGIKAGLSKTWDGLKAVFRWSPIGLIARHWGGIKSATGNAVQAAKATAEKAWNGLKTVFRWSPIGLIKNNWSTIKSAIAAPVTAAKAKLTAAWTEIKAAFSGGLGEVAALLLDWSPFGLLWRGISAALERLGVDIPEKFSGMGGWIIDGIKAGITGKLGELKASITGVADSASGWFKDKLGINSPSRVFARFGGYTVDGLNQGLDAQRDEPARRVRDIAKRVAAAGAGMAIGGAAIASPTAPTLPDMPARYSELVAPKMPTLDALRIERPELGALGIEWPELPQFAPLTIDTRGVQFDARRPLQSPASGGGDVHITMGDINVRAAPGMDEQALARLVNAEVQRALATAGRDAAARRRSAFQDID